MSDPSSDPVILIHLTNQKTAKPGKLFIILRLGFITYVLRYLDYSFCLNLSS